MIEGAPPTTVDGVERDLLPGMIRVTGPACAKRS